MISQNLPNHWAGLHAVIPQIRRFPSYRTPVQSAMVRWPYIMTWPVDHVTLTLHVVRSDHRNKNSSQQTFVSFRSLLHERMWVQQWSVFSTLLRHTRQLLLRMWHWIRARSIHIQLPKWVIRIETSIELQYYWSIIVPTTMIILTFFSLNWNHSNQFTWFKSFESDHTTIYQIWIIASPFCINEQNKEKRASFTIF